MRLRDPTFIFFYGFNLKVMRADNSFRKDSHGVIRFPRSHWDLGIISPSLIETAVSDPAVSYGIYRGFNDTAESASEFSLRLLNLFQKCKSDPAVSLKMQKPIPQSHWNRRNQSHGLIETVESELCKRLSPLSRQIQSNMRNGFSPWIRALEGTVWWKNRGLKISWHCPFNFSFRLTNNFLSYGNYR
jgi:hypothetical protein